MKILITICARGGSKGIPKKNIKKIAGKPLLHYSLEQAIELKNSSKHEIEIMVSTDCDEILDCARQTGIECPYKRPDFLATDTAGKLGALYDALSFSEDYFKCEFDYLLDLDVTSPLRNLKDINEALNLIESDKKALTIFSVSPANRNPYFNMVEKKSNGYYSLVCNPEHSILSRQKAPIVYDMNASFYIFRKNFFKLDIKTPITKKSIVYVVPHICFDLDHPIDFEFMTYLIENKKLDFEL